MQTIKNLVFEGGGVKGIAYAGAIKALEELNVMPNIERVAGTSAGAITSTLVAIGCDADTIYKYVGSTNFKSFEDDWNPLHIPTKYGLYKGDFFLNWIKGIFSDLKIDPNATFSDLKNLGMKDLHVFATDLNLKDSAEFSFSATPDVIVTEAVRASMSIPLFFEAWKFTNGKPNNHIYVDGGVVYNYPLTTFDDDAEPNMATLGLHLDDISNQAAASNLDYNDILHYTIRLFDTLLDGQDIDEQRDKGMLTRSVKIDDFGISATNFDLSKDEQTKLYNSGYQSTKAFFNHQ